jgi:hypothetical protein
MKGNDFFLATIDSIESLKLIDTAMLKFGSIVKTLLLLLAESEEI